MLAFILKRIGKTQVKKKILRKYARKFIKAKGWEQRRRFVLVHRRPEEMEENEFDQPNNLIHFLNMRKTFRRE
jgi:hypothetical protein